LIPLPQPAQVPEPKYEPSFSVLPAWLAKPITVSSSAKASFGTLNLDHKTVEHLKQRGYEEAFAVQTAVLPLLLPGPDRHHGDICVSAATGSGKTLAYVLPMVEGLKGSPVTRLRALIVVPTRELVAQARDVAELCAAGTGLKIGTAVGSHSFATEQGQLVKRGRKYDPDAAKAMHAEAKQNLLNGILGKSEVLDDAVSMLPGHVPEYTSKVDILICTPGRLVEHINSTTGFNLDHVQWLVIDEADRLLDQSFQEWVNVVMSALETEKPYEQLSAREQILSKLWYPPEKRTIAKVVLSATMTRDLSKLASLKLRRPRLVSVQGIESGTETVDRAQEAQQKQADGTGEAFDLPSTLEEFAMPVGDGNDKPLHLLWLLQTKLLQRTGQAEQGKSGTVASSNRKDSAETDTESSSGSGSHDSSSEDASETSSSSGSDVDSGSESSDSVSTADTDHDPVEDSKSLPKILVFTNNNENASRLSRLLALLDPACGPITGTLTKSSASSNGRRVLHGLRNGKLSIVIASDRASRGLDIAKLTHIVNYDMPRSVTSYVHRVGRTARAGRKGQAWTLFTDAEARWFWNAIARAPDVNRGGRKVERMRMAKEAVGEDRQSVFHEALEQLQLAVRGNAE